MRSVGAVHGWVAHQLNELFNAEKIVFAGPLADFDAFLAAVRQTARELGGAGRDCVIVSSTLGQYNGAVGAAARRRSAFTRLTSSIMPKGLAR